MADKTDQTEPFVHPLVGEPDGFVNHHGDKLVYEYDEKGDFTGWHFEPAKETK